MSIKLLFCLREMTPLLSQSLFEAQKLKRRQRSQPWSLLQARSFPHSAPRRGRKAALHLSTAEPQHAAPSLRFFHLFASSCFLVTGFFHGFLNNNKKYYISPKYIDSKHTPYQCLPSNHSLCYMHHANQTYPRNTPKHTGGTLIKFFPSIGTSLHVRGLGGCQALPDHFLSPLSTTQIQTCCKTV